MGFRTHYSKRQQAPCHTEYFKLEELEKTAEVRGSLWSSLCSFPLKEAIKTSGEKCLSYIWRKGAYLSSSTSCQASSCPVAFTLSALLSPGAGSLAQQIYKSHLPTLPPWQWSPAPFPGLFPSHLFVSLTSLSLSWAWHLSGAIFPSSPLGCEHPGTRDHVTSVSLMAPGQGSPSGHGAHQEWQLCFSTGHPWGLLTKDQIPSGWSRGPTQRKKDSAMCQEPF